MPDNYITLSQLTKTTKGLVNKINAESTVTNSKIGDLADLNTTAKTNLVAAINEAAASGTQYDDTALAGRVTALENAGYITSYTETDPTVPAWAKAATKPTYTAEEVGAISSSTVIPKKVWNVTHGTYDGDYWWTTGLQRSDLVKITNAPGNDGAVRYINIPSKNPYNTIIENSNWNTASEDIKISLPNKTGTIALTSDIPSIPAWALATNKPTYTASEVGALPSTYTAPVTSVNGQTGEVNLTIPAAQVQSDWNATTGMGVILNKPTIPDVPSWALASSKPTYTASEVGALPSSTTYVSSFNGNTGAITYSAPVSSVNGDTGAVIVDQLKTTGSSNNTEYNLIGTATSNANTTAVDVYKQDLLSFAKTTSLGRLTIGSTSMPGVVRIYTSADSASGFTDIKSNASSTNERTITLPDASGTIALTNDIPSVPSWAMASSKPSYTFSELTSHPTTISGYGITDAYTKTEVDGLVSGVLHYKGTKATVSALPSSGNVTGDVWHITADGSEWAWDSSAWQELGTAVDLSGYLQTGDIASWAKAANKPSYTASEVGALPSSTTYVSSFNGNTGAITYTAPVTSVNNQTGAVTLFIPTAPGDIGAAASSHAHGNITSGGDMTATAAIASGDRLVINDESASKLVSSTITFGSSTAQYLANNGTWQNVYDDTALAARVTALEQIPWVTYYTGSTTPNNSQGNNGDLYFQTAQ